VYVPALQKMGCEIEVFAACLGGPACRFHDTNAVHSAVIRGVSKLRGADVTLPDVRAGFSAVLAARHPPHRARLPPALRAVRFPRPHPAPRMTVRPWCRPLWRRFRDDHEADSMISDPGHRIHVGFGPGSWNAQLRRRLAAVRPNALPVLARFLTASPAGSLAQGRPGSLASGGVGWPIHGTRARTAFHERSCRPGRGVRGSCGHLGQWGWQTCGCRGRPGRQARCQPEVPPVMHASVRLPGFWGGAWRAADYAMPRRWLMPSSSRVCRWRGLRAPGSDQETGRP
jgi:hypothetical protein